jgi:hypothetical protein
MIRVCWGVLLALLLVLGLSIPASAAVEVIVDVGLPFFADPKDAEGYPAPNPSGTQVCVHIGIYPYGTLNIVSLTVCGGRTSLVPATSCNAIKGLIVNRAASLEPPVIVNATDILVHACTN